MKKIVLASLFILLSSHAAVAQNGDADDHWAPLRPLVGKWIGHRTGLGGDADQTVEWKFVLGGQFLQCKTTSINAQDPHEDLGMISYDKSRKKFIYRSFFSEGFVNQYVGKISAGGKEFVFESEVIENGPPGLRAMETIYLDGNKIRQECKLASGDEPFKVCISVQLEKQK